VDLDASIVRSLTRAYSAGPWLRIIRRPYMATPLGPSPSQSRFSSSSGDYKLLYAGKTLKSAVAEAILRDRFANDPRLDRVIDISEVQDYAITEISIIGSLELVDLRKGGAFQLGVKTDAVGAKNHSAGRAFAQRLYDQFPDIDGILYPSRMTGCDCIAIFDRSISGNLFAVPSVELERLSDLPDALTELSVDLVHSP